MQTYPSDALAALDRPRNTHSRAYERLARAALTRVLARLDGYRASVDPGFTRITLIDRFNGMPVQQTGLVTFLKHNGEPEAAAQLLDLAGVNWIA